MSLAKRISELRKGSKLQKEGIELLKELPKIQARQLKLKFEKEQKK